jgi:hypothetical protein
MLWSALAVCTGQAVSAQVVRRSWHVLSFMVLSAWQVLSFIVLSSPHGLPFVAGCTDIPATSARNVPRLCVNDGGAGISGAVPERQLASAGLPRCPRGMRSNDFDADNLLLAVDVTRPQPHHFTRPQPATIGKR